MILYTKKYADIDELHRNFLNVVETISYKNLSIDKILSYQCLGFSSLKISSKNHLYLNASSSI